VGVAWASILSMPYAILSTALPAHRMGVYMGVFNFFIVIPEIIASLGFGPMTRTLFGEGNPNAPLYVVMMGGGCLLLACALVSLIDDSGRETAPLGETSASSPVFMGESVQPVAVSTALD
jgi:maltose/moltooligosaccharide transporter